MSASSFLCLGDLSVLRYINSGPCETLRFDLYSEIQDSCRQEKLLIQVLE